MPVTLSLSSEPQARSLYWPRTHREKGPLWAKRMSGYIRVWEVRGQVPGTTRNAHAPPGLKLHKGARGSGAPGYPRRGTRRSKTPLDGVTSAIPASSGSRILSGSLLIVRNCRFVVHRCLYFCCISVSDSPASLPRLCFVSASSLFHLCLISGSPPPRLCLVFASRSSRPTIVYWRTVHFHLKNKQ